MSEFTPSAYQQAIFDWIQSGRGNAVVNAVAGSGKTTTLVQGAHLIKAERAVFCAFNKHIADELRGRLANTPLQAKTIHSLGNGVLYNALGKTRLENMKYWKLAKRWVDDNEFALRGTIGSYQATRYLKTLADMARLTLADESDVMAMSALAARYIDEVQFPQYLLLGVAWVLAQGVSMAERDKVIDFTDMIWLPLRLDLAPPQFDWIFIDEMQDLNECQAQLVLKMRSPTSRVLGVGDRRQAIMGFAGANSDSFDRVKSTLDATELPLSICYRCPTSHVDLARTIVPHIEAHDGAPAGSIRTIQTDQLTQVAQEGDIVLCRVTAPLIKWCMKFIEQKISARVRGRDIGKELTTLMRNIAQPDMDYKEFGKTLEDYESRATEFLRAQEGGERRVEMLHDKCEAIRTCWVGFTNCQSIDDLAREIEGLFDDRRPSVWFSTVHRAKGLENDRVFILDPSRMPLSWPNQRPDELEQEMNLKYVALTRAKAELVFVG